MKNIIFKEIKLRKNNCRNNSTDRRNVLGKIYKSNNLGEKSGSELKENPENKILIYHGKILINKSWLNFWGITIMYGAPPPTPTSI